MDEEMFEKDEGVEVMGELRSRRRSASVAEGYLPPLKIFDYY